MLGHMGMLPIIADITLINNKIQIQNRSNNE